MLNNGKMVQAFLHDAVNGKCDIDFEKFVANKEAELNEKRSKAHFNKSTVEVLLRSGNAIYEIIGYLITTDGLETQALSDKLCYLTQLKNGVSELVEKNPEYKEVLDGLDKCISIVSSKIDSVKVSDGVAGNECAQQKPDKMFTDLLREHINGTTAIKYADKREFYRVVEYFKSFITKNGLPDIPKTVNRVNCGHFRKYLQNDLKYTPSTIDIYMRSFGMVISSYMVNERNKSKDEIPPFLQELCEIKIHRNIPTRKGAATDKVPANAPLVQTDGITAANDNILAADGGLGLLKIQSNHTEAAAVPPAPKLTECLADINAQDSKTTTGAKKLRITALKCFEKFLEYSGLENNITIVTPETFKGFEEYLIKVKNYANPTYSSCVKLLVRSYYKSMNGEVPAFVMPMRPTKSGKN